MNYTKTNRDTYDTISENWETKRKSIWTPVKEFLEVNKNFSKLLDLGCGTGRFLELAESLNYKKKNLVGADFSKGQLELVKKKRFKTIQTELTNLKFKDKEFDLIICIAAHHHLLDKQEQLKSLEERNRILKDEGKILLANWFPEKKFIEKQLEKKKFEFLNKEKQEVKVTYTFQENKFDRYYYLFKEKELIDLCTEVNFKIENKEYNNGNLYLTLNKQ